MDASAAAVAAAAAAVDPSSLLQPIKSPKCRGIGADGNKTGGAVSPAMCLQCVIGVGSASTQQRLPSFSHHVSSSGLAPNGVTPVITQDSKHHSPLLLHQPARKNGSNALLSFACGGRGDIGNWVNDSALRKGVPEITVGGRASGGDSVPIQILPSSGFPPPTATSRIPLRDQARSVLNPPHHNHLTPRLNQYPDQNFNGVCEGPVAAPTSHSPPPPSTFDGEGRVVRNRGRRRAVRGDRSKGAQRASTDRRKLHVSTAVPVGGDVGTTDEAYGSRMDSDAVRSQAKRRRIQRRPKPPGFGDSGTCAERGGVVGSSAAARGRVSASAVNCRADKCLEAFWLQPMEVLDSSSSAPSPDDVSGLPWRPEAVGPSSWPSARSLRIGWCSGGDGRAEGTAGHVSLSMGCGARGNPPGGDCVAASWDVRLTSAWMFPQSYLGRNGRLCRRNGLLKGCRKALRAYSLLDDPENTYELMVPWTLTRKEQGSERRLVIPEHTVTLRPEVGGNGGVGVRDEGSGCCGASTSSTATRSSSTSTRCCSNCSSSCNNSSNNNVNTGRHLNDFGCGVHGSNNSNNCCIINSSCRSGECLIRTKPAYLLLWKYSLRTFSRDGTARWYVVQASFVPVKWFGKAFENHHVDIMKCKTTVIDTISYVSPRKEALVRAWCLAGCLEATLKDLGIPNFQVREINDGIYEGFPEPFLNDMDQVEDRVLRMVTDPESHAHVESEDEDEVKNVVEDDCHHRNITRQDLQSQQQQIRQHHLQRHVIRALHHHQEQQQQQHQLQHHQVQINILPQQQLQQQLHHYQQHQPQLIQQQTQQQLQQQLQQQNQQQQHVAVPSCSLQTKQQQHRQLQLQQQRQQLQHQKQQKQQKQQLTRQLQHRHSAPMGC